MSEQASNPTNKNFLSPIGFRFTMKRLPHVNYFCTSASIPDVQLGQIERDTPFIRIPQPGDKLLFGTMNINFRVDEDLRNFREIYDWMTALGYPDNFAQRAAVGRTATSVGNEYSDGSLIITTSSYTPNIEVRFVDMFPVSLNTTEFNIENSDVEYVTATASFAYRKYELTAL
jgi:hypothetical protein